MSFDVSRRAALHAGLALCASSVVPAARACEFFSPRLRVYHPWTRVTPESAPFANVFMRVDQVTGPDRLIGVETMVATRAQLIGMGTDKDKDKDQSGVDLSFQPGSELVMSEAGIHLRLLGLTQPLLIGRTYPMRLVFEQGGPLDAQLSVDYMAFQ